MDTLKSLADRQDAPVRSILISCYIQWQPDSNEGANAACSQQRDRRSSAEASTVAALQSIAAHLQSCVACSGLLGAALDRQPLSPNAEVTAPPCIVSPPVGMRASVHRKRASGIQHALRKFGANCEFADEAARRKSPARGYTSPAVHASCRSKARMRYTAEKRSIVRFERLESTSDLCC